MEKEVIEMSKNIKGREFSIQELDLPKHLLDNLDPENGLILISGSTNSGKTTLLQSILDWRENNSEKDIKIISYEDPGEDRLDFDGLVFSEKQTGIFYDIENKNLVLSIRNEALKNPDMIFIDGIRDREMLNEAVSGSLEGKLVYAAINANFVSDVVRRVLGLFSENEKNTEGLKFIKSLRLIVSQILIPSVSGSMIAIREYLVITPDIAEKIINAGSDHFKIETEKQVQLGGHTFAKDAKEKFKQGLITKKWSDHIEMMFSYKCKDYVV